MPIAVEGPPGSLASLLRQAHCARFDPVQSPPPRDARPARPRHVGMDRHHPLDIISPSTFRFSTSISDRDGHPSKWVSRVSSTALLVAFNTAEIHRRPHRVALGARATGDEGPRDEDGASMSTSTDPPSFHHDWILAVSWFNCVWLAGLILVLALRA